MEIRFKKIKAQKSEKTVEYEATPMNIIKEELKSSHKMDSPKGHALYHNLNILEKKQYTRKKLKHQRQSSKSTKKLEFSLVSMGKSVEIGKLGNHTFVNASISSVAFNKQEQRRKRKEVNL